MSSDKKVIITCAITGSVHTPSMSPYLPVTAEQIAKDAIAAAQAGAAIVHLHARNPKDGRPDQTPQAFEPFLKEIRRKSDVVVNLTTGGSSIMTIEERGLPAFTFQPEVASLNMGSMNFGLFPMAKGSTEFKYEWERQYLEGTRSNVFRNTFADIEYILRGCAEHGTKFEVECYDIGHLYTLAHFAERGVLKPPFLIQSVFGILGGIGAHPEDVLHMRRTADHLFGRQNYVWSVLGAGRNQIPVGVMSMTLGGNVRVGLEDSLWLKKGKLATSNAEQVTQIRGIAEQMGLTIATPDEARSILGLKGSAKVNF